MSEAQRFRARRRVPREASAATPPAPVAAARAAIRAAVSLRRTAPRRGDQGLVRGCCLRAVCGLEVCFATGPGLGASRAAEAALCVPLEAALCVPLGLLGAAAAGLGVGLELGLEPGSEARSKAGLKAKSGAESGVMATQLAAAAPAVTRSVGVIATGPCRAVSRSAESRLAGLACLAWVCPSRDARPTRLGLGDGCDTGRGGATWAAVAVARPAAVG